MNELLMLIWIHWFADFILQTDKVALNKSRNNLILTLHSTIYTIPFLLFGWKFAIFNGVMHFFVDFITSRLTSYYWSIDNRHKFFIIVGLDQAIHISILIISLSWFI